MPNRHCVSYTVDACLLLVIGVLAPVCGKFDSLTAEMLTASLQTISATARKLIELIDEPAGAEQSVAA
jgi:hypothetical protein